MTQLWVFTYKHEIWHAFVERHAFVEIPLRTLKTMNTRYRMPHDSLSMKRHRLTEFTFAAIIVMGWSGILFYPPKQAEYHQFGRHFHKIYTSSPGVNGSHWIIKRIKGQPRDEK